MLMFLYFQLYQKMWPVSQLDLKGLNPVADMLILGLDVLYKQMDTDTDKMH